MPIIDEADIVDVAPSGGRILSPDEIVDTATGETVQIQDFEPEVSEFYRQHPNIFGAVGAGKALLEAGSNIPRSARELGSNIFQAVRHPVQTASALGDVALGGIEKLIPGEQRHEAVFNAVAAELGKQYGSIDAINKHAIENPVVFASDVAGIITGLGVGVKAVGAAGRVGALTKLGKAAGAAGKVVDPLSGALQATGAVTKRVRPINSLVKTALDLSKTKGLTRIDDLADSFVKRGLNVNRKSLRVLDKDMKVVRGHIDDIIDRKTATGVTIKTEAIVDSLNDLLGNAGKQGLEAKDLKTVIRMRDAFAEQHGAVLTPRQVQNIKIGFNKGFKPNLETRFGQVQSKARNKMRGAAKLQLEELHPELKGLNIDEGVMIELREAIESSIIKVEKQAIIPRGGLVVGGVVGGVTGAGAGAGTGLAFGIGVVLMDKIITSPRVQVAIAKALHKSNLKLAKAGKLSKVTRPAFQAGRVSEAAPPAAPAPTESESVRGLQSNGRRGHSPTEMGFTPRNTGARKR